MHRVDFPSGDDDTLSFALSSHGAHAWSADSQPELCCGVAVRCHLRYLDSLKPGNRTEQRSSQQNRENRNRKQTNRPHNLNQTLRTALPNDHNSSTDTTHQSNDRNPRRNDGKRVRGRHDAADGSRGIDELAHNVVTFDERDDDAARNVFESPAADANGPCTVDPENPPWRNLLYGGVDPSRSFLKRPTIATRQVPIHGATHETHFHPCVAARGAGVVWWEAIGRTHREGCEKRRT